MIASPRTDVMVAAATSASNGSPLESTATIQLTIGTVA